MLAIASLIEKELHGDDVKYTDRARECTSHGLHLFSFQAQQPAELLKKKWGYVFNLCAHLIAYGNYTESAEVSQGASSLYASLNGEDHESTQMKTKTADAYRRLRGGRGEAGPGVGSARSWRRGLPQGGQRRHACNYRVGRRRGEGKGLRYFGTISRRIRVIRRDRKSQDVQGNVTSVPRALSKVDEHFVLV